MKFLKLSQTFVLASAVAVALAVAASPMQAAAIISVGGCNTLAATGVTTCTAGVTTIDFNSSSSLPAGFTSSSGAITSGTLPGSHYAPTYPVYPSGTVDTSNYLVTNIGSLTFIPGSNFNYFGLYFGSIDNYNSITLYGTDGSTQTLTAAQVAGALVDTGSSQFFNFLDPSGAQWNKIVVTSQFNNFESDNWAFGNVAIPEPASLGLMGIGFLFAGFAYRRRRALQ